MKTNRDENRGAVPNQTVELLSHTCLFSSLCLHLCSGLFDKSNIQSLCLKVGKPHPSFILSLCNSAASVLTLTVFWSRALFLLFPKQFVCLFWTNRATLPFLTAEPTRILSPLMLEIIKSIIRRLWCDLVRSLYGRSTLDMSRLFWQIISKWQTDWGLSTVTGFKLLNVFHENFQRSRKDSLLKQLSSIQRMIRWCWWWWWWAALGFQVLFLSKI